MATFNTDMDAQVMQKVRAKPSLQLAEKYDVNEVKTRQENPKQKKDYIKTINLNMKRAGKHSGFQEYDELEFSFKP